MCDFEKNAAQNGRDVAQEKHYSAQKSCDDTQMRHVTTTAHTQATALKLTNYSFTYPGQAHAVFGPLELKITAGEFVLLVGVTGSGKTTFLKSLLPGNILCGKRTGDVLLPHAECGSAYGTTASVVVLPHAQGGCAGGEAASERARDAHIPSIAYVSQSPQAQLVCETVWHELAFSMENYGMSRSIMRRRVAEVSHFFGIEPWFHKNVNDLSGGQAQIVSLARALACGPKLLLLDEPTAQLDPVAEKNFLHALFRINRELGISVVVATHSPECVRDYATRALRLKNGKIEDVPLTSFSYGTLQASVCPHTPIPSTSPAAISLLDAHFRYSKTSPWVLCGFDAQIQSGEIRALVGGNGSGKTTALKLIAGIEKPKHGSVRNAFMQSQAYMPQFPASLFVCDTVSQEVREWQISCGYSDQDINKMLEKVGLSGKEQQHPFDLSGGEQQLLALVKLLLTRPALLLLDEPTKGLDARTKLVVANLIQDFASAGGTVVLSTHDLSFALCVAHSATLIFDGAATCTEPVRDFFKNNMFYVPCANEFTQLFMCEHANVTTGADAGAPHSTPTPDAGAPHSTPTPDAGAPHITPTTAARK